MSEAVTRTPLILLRLEGLFVLVAASAAYSRLGISWWLFAALFLAPDLSMFGYLAGRKVGAVCYNALHWYGVPFVCIGFGAFEHTSIILALGLIGAAHIGFDRALGYGLKYVEGFGHTHLGSKGKAAQA